MSKENISREYTDFTFYVSMVSKPWGGVRNFFNTPLYICFQVFMLVKFNPDDF